MFLFSFHDNKIIFNSVNLRRNITQFPLHIAVIRGEVLQRIKLFQNLVVVSGEFDLQIPNQKFAIKDDDYNFLNNFKEMDDVTNKPQAIGVKWQRRLPKMSGNGSHFKHLLCL